MMCEPGEAEMFNAEINSQDDDTGHQKDHSILSNDPVAQCSKFNQSHVVTVGRAGYDVGRDPLRITPHVVKNPQLC